MQSSVETVLNAFLHQTPTEERTRLMQFLPEATRLRLTELAAPSPLLLEARINADRLFEHVHWSWFLPTLNSHSAQEQALFLAALDASMSLPLASHISCKSATHELSSIGRSYLRQFLLDSLIGVHDGLIPIEALPPSPLNRILELSKKQIVSLFDLLAMHDLAVEIRQIVETKILQKLYSFLKVSQRAFLKQIASKPEGVVLPRMGLDQWDGEKDSLQHLLHRRGLARFGIALSGQDPALIWYICHQLDIGRGSALFKLCVREGSGATVDAALRQVDELLGQDL